ncbi:hypothetical protein D3C81_1489440 [compost metagenome]
MRIFAYDQRLIPSKVPEPVQRREQFWDAARANAQVENRNREPRADFVAAYFGIFSASRQQNRLACECWPSTKQTVVTNFCVLGIVNPDGLADRSSTENTNVVA